MSCPAPWSAASARSANAGVPAKIRRRKARSGALAQLLGEARADALLLQLREVLDEYLALEVVELMLDANRQQSLCLQGERGAVLVECTHLHALCALHELIDPGQRKTAFFDIRNAGCIDDLRID